MIKYPGYLFNIPACFEQVAIVKNQALWGIAAILSLGCSQFYELHAKHPQYHPPAYLRVILQPVKHILTSFDMVSHRTAGKRMNRLHTQERQANQTGKYRLKAIPSLLQRG
jgi:hypothetical protein